MAIDIVMPPLSQTSDTLILSGWLKKVGDPVSKGEALFEVETDKATLTVESPASGILQEISADPGSEVAVKTRIGSIAEPVLAAAKTTMGSPATAAAADMLPSGPGIRFEPGSLAGNAPAAAPQAASRAERILASPRARRLADQAGIGLDGLKATGPRGMIVERDVRAHLASAEQSKAAAPQTQPVKPVAAAVAASEAPAPAASKRVPLTATRKTIARRLQSSHQAATPVTLTRDTDATELVALRERLLLNLEAQEARPTYTDLLASITARCLQRHPHLNAHFDGEQLEIFESVHIGLAVDTERGLIVPVLRDVARGGAHKGLAALARERSALVQRTLDGTVTPDELAGGTITITNLGTLGIDAFTPLLNPPQIAILGIGRIRAIAAPHNGVIAVRQAMFLSLTFDHRAVDGAPAARLLADIAALVEQPERVWL